MEVTGHSTSRPPPLLPQRQRQEESGASARGSWLNWFPPAPSPQGAGEACNQLSGLSQGPPCCTSAFEVCKSLPALNTFKRQGPAQELTPLWLPRLSTTRWKIQPLVDEFNTPGRAGICLGGTGKRAGTCRHSGPVTGQGMPMCHSRPQHQHHSPARLKGDALGSRAGRRQKRLTTPGQCQFGEPSGGRGLAS